ncbi:hypothetical protein SLEP1_g44954 [Rubroshorea leprosula]|uniref:Uncharacterized protein n=1 Tax=Rubroshorea leprosula TaxID=152421 RepID=A0AAV5LI75_9ROSI|nr:hypothetical protein SLEP1_g44954 [Rubroshorea leprosula]
MIIKPLNLCKSFCNKTSLVSFNCAISLVFYFVDPFATYRFFFSKGSVSKV